MVLICTLNISDLFHGGWTVSGSVVLNIGVAVLLGYILYRLVRFFVWFQYIKNVFKDVPGPKDTHWLYGNLHLLPEDSEKQLMTAYTFSKSFPKMFKFWIGPFHATLVVNHPDTLRHVFKSVEPKPTGPAGAYRFGLPWLGRGLLIAEGERWAHSRRLLTSAFHFDILKPYIDVYNDAGNILLEKLQPVAMSGKSFEVFQVVSLCTLDIILRCAFSYYTDCQIKGLGQQVYTFNQCNMCCELRVSASENPDLIIARREVSRSGFWILPTRPDLANNIALPRYKFELDPDHTAKKKVAAVMRSDNGIMLCISKR